MASTVVKMQDRYRQAQYNRAMAIAEAGKGSVKAMEYLVWLIDHGENEAVRLKAAVHVLNWGVGKPRDALDPEGGRGEIILRDILAERRAAAAAEKAAS